MFRFKLDNFFVPKIWEMVEKFKTDVDIRLHLVSKMKKNSISQHILEKKCSIIKTKSNLSTTKKF